jgi:hypothetical protein
MDENGAPCQTYEIRIAGVLHPRWQEWFAGFVVAPGPVGETILRGRVRDQAALHGVLAQIRDLNLTLIAVERIDTP